VYKYEELKRCVKMQNYTWLIYISHLSLLMVPWSSVRVGTKTFTESHRKVGQ